MFDRLSEGFNNAFRKLSGQSRLSEANIREAMDEDGAAADAVDAIEAQAAEVVDEVLGAHPRLKRGLGKKVFELQPDLPWDKGEAVLWIAERLGCAAADAVTVYLGDDITDEHAFRALAGRGLGVGVRSADARATAAGYALAGSEEVRRFLEMLSTIAASQDAVGGPR